MLCTPQGSEGALPLGEARRKDLTVPASSVGKIIGRAGEMVRELQSRSQAKIQVDHTGKAFNSDTRSVSIVGTPEAVMKAEEMVMFLVANPLLDAMKAIRMLVDDKLKIGGRWGSGPPYTSMPNQGQGMAPMDGGFGGGPPQHQQYGGGGGYTQGGPPAGHGYGGPPPQHQQGYGGGGGYQQGSETEIYPAAKMYMGRIIGQRGVTINDLQKRSGCDIQINQDVPPGQDCIITIKGARPGIEHTKQMLREIIEMGPGHPYAGGNGRELLELSKYLCAVHQSSNFCIFF
jgi:far upstream element-binding protein